MTRAGNGGLLKRLYIALIRAISAPRSWWLAVTERGKLEREMEAELQDHLERRTADLIVSGLPVADAARQARIELGSPAVHKDKMRASLGLRIWDELAADARYGARRLRRSPGFTLIAVVSLALAIGANTTIFSMAKQVLYERLAVPHAEQLRLLAWNATSKHRAVHSIWGENAILPDGRFSSSSFSYPVYEQLHAQSMARNGVMQELFAFKDVTGNATIAGEARRAGGQLVSGDYFCQLNVRPALGRLIAEPDDVSTRAGAVAVLSYGVWDREYGRSPAVLGQTVKLNEVPLTIIGVAPRAFTGAYSTLQAPDLFVPISMQPLVRPDGNQASLLDSDQEWWVNVMGRLRPDVPEASALAALDTQLNAAARATLPVRPDEDLPRMELRDGSRGLFMQGRSFVQPMRVLLTMVGLVLLLACANIANLMLARGTQRQREMSVRLALGASGARIARQMLVESLLLAMLGGAGGTVLGYIGSNLAPKLVSYGWQRNDFQVHFDWKVWIFTVGITLATGILFGLAPALSASRVRVGNGLKESSQSVTRRRTGWGGRSLVGFQIALSTLLVVGAGLFLRTLTSLNSVDVGFRTDHLLLAQVSLPPKEYAARKDVQFHTRVLAAIAALPGVEGVSPASSPYIAGNSNSTGFRVEGARSGKDADYSESYTVVGNDFFSMMRIPILEGRVFGSQDTSTSGKVAIINASLAKEVFPNQNPVGRRFYNNDEGPIQIVGVCGDTRYASLRDEPPPQFFLPFVQQTHVSGSWTYEVRTKTDPESIVPLMRKAVRDLDPDLPLINVRTQEQQIEATTQTERTFVALTTGFGALALMLAAVGIYGVMAYSVSNRTNEIGIRLALGAQQRQVLTMVLREATWMSVAGIAVGLGAALVLARLVQSMLYGLRANDPWSLGMGAGLLFMVGIAASWLPAHRAASIEPMEALRCE